MSCPVCGGSSRQLIAPGYWRCTSAANDIETGAGPDPYAPPGLGMVGPRDVVRTRVCGHEYHEGQGATPGLECECGTFAIGRCAECRVPICGSHSRLVDDRRLCWTHASAVERRRWELQHADELQHRENLARAQQAQAERLQRARARLPRFLEAMNRAGNPGSIDVYGYSSSRLRGVRLVVESRGWVVLTREERSDDVQRETQIVLRRDGSLAKAISDERGLVGIGRTDLHDGDQAWFEIEERLLAIAQEHGLAI